MIVSAGLAEPCVGITLPSAMNRFGTSQARWSASTTLSLGARAHPAPADEVGVAVDRRARPRRPPASKMSWSVCLANAMFVRSLSHCE